VGEIVALLTLRFFLQEKALVYSLRRTIKHVSKNLSGAKGVGYYIAVYDTSFFENLWLVVVVDVEPLPQYFVLFRRYCSREFLFGSSCLYPSFLDKCPECGVVEVVDVALSKVSATALEMVETVESRMKNDELCNCLDSEDIG
jgi:hypothetical protein